MPQWTVTDAMDNGIMQSHGPFATLDEVAIALHQIGAPYRCYVSEWRVYGMPPIAKQTLGDQWLKEMGIETESKER